MQNDEALKGLRAIGLAVNHIHDVLLELLALSIPAGPTITSSSSLLGDEDILGIVEVSVLAHLDGVDDLREGKGTLGSRSTSIDLGM